MPRAARPGPDRPCRACRVRTSAAVRAPSVAAEADTWRTEPRAPLRRHVEPPRADRASLRVPAEEAGSRPSQTQTRQSARPAWAGFRVHGTTIWVDLALASSPLEPD